MPSVVAKKSRILFEKSYQDFVKWCDLRQVTCINESAVLVYFNERSQILKPSTLWSVYSMLKSTK